jgi:hypothetical protein
MWVTGVRCEQEHAASPAGRGRDAPELRTLRAGVTALPAWRVGFDDAGAGGQGTGCARTNVRGAIMVRACGTMTGAARRNRRGGALLLGYSRQACSPAAGMSTR